MSAVDSLPRILTHQQKKIDLLGWMVPKNVTNVMKRFLSVDFIAEHQNPMVTEIAT